MNTGMVPNKVDANEPGFRDGLMAGFKDIFALVTKTDGPEINQQTRKMLDKGQQDTIRRSLQQIDSVLKKDCLFCGSILIDMIDNDVEATAKESEFADGKKKNPYQVSGKEKGKDDEWEIK